MEKKERNTKKEEKKRKNEEKKKDKRGTKMKYEEKTKKRNKQVKYLREKNQIKKARKNWTKNLKCIFMFYSPISLWNDIWLFVTASNPLKWNEFCFTIESQKKQFFQSKPHVVQKKMRKMFSRLKMCINALKCSLRYCR